MSIALFYSSDRTPYNDRSVWYLCYGLSASITIDEQEIVFDNIDCNGVTRQEWLQNLTSPTLELGMGSIKVIEEEF